MGKGTLAWIELPMNQGLVSEQDKAKPELVGI